MSNSEKQFYFSTIVWLAIMLIFTVIMAMIRIEQLKNERNSLIKQTCDYSLVAQTDTVTELCTKYLEQTQTEFIQVRGGDTRVERK